MRSLISFYSSFFLTKRFFIISLVIILMFIAGFVYPVMINIGFVAIAILLFLVLVDTVLLYQKRDPFLVSREMAEKLSNGDRNMVYLTIENQYPFQVNTQLIDELPIQFQQRNFVITVGLNSGQSKLINYYVRPTERGRFIFRKLNVLTSNQFLGLVKRKLKYFEDEESKVYPSIIQMKKYEFLAISNQLREYGIKKLRRIGQSQEFEQIREYVIGDDYRNINWKATGRKHSLMVNEYIDERSQRVYSIIDKGRVMKMPFDGLTLLDYSINACLALSNVVIKHQNKPGLITFSKQIDSFLPAENKSSQMNHLLEQLYAQQTDFEESNYEDLFLQVRKRLSQRSLLLFFTNFESRNALYRQIKYLRSLSRKHVLVVIFFENTELEKITTQVPENPEQVYIKTISKKLVYDKQFIVSELNKYGIYSILTKPQDLTVNTINKYLELRSRGLIN